MADEGGSPPPGVGAAGAAGGAGAAGADVAAAAGAAFGNVVAAGAANSVARIC